MTIQTLTLGKRRFVVVPERDFEVMRQENKRYRQMVEEDKALGKLAEKELKEFRKGGSKGIPWEQARNGLG